MKSAFNRQERMILKVVFEEQRGMSVREIAKKSQMSWITAKKYIDNFIRKQWLSEKGNKIRFNYSLLGITRRGHEN